MAIKVCGIRQLPLIPKVERSDSPSRTQSPSGDPWPLGFCLAKSIIPRELRPGFQPFLLALSNYFMIPTQTHLEQVLRALGNRLRVFVSFALASFRVKSSKAKIVAMLCFFACVSLSGCTLCQNFKRTIFDEPSEFSWMEDREESMEVYRTWADQAWGEQCSADPEQGASRIYAAGFKDGFVDYVYAGGSGEPPPVPPRRFWNVDRRNPQGHMGAADWFAGYRHGSQVAREEGYRERAIVPVSMFLSNSKDTYGKRPQNRVENPSWLPMADPQEPEFLPLAEGTPVGEQPVLENPADQLTDVDPSDNDLKDSGEEPLPLPQEKTPEVTEPVAERAVEIPVETEPGPPSVPDTTPALPEASPEVDDIFDLFDPSAVDQASKPSQEICQSKYEAVDPGDAKVQQALSAFTFAVQGQKRTEPAETKPTVTKSVESQPRTTRSASRTTTIPQSWGRSQGMFRQFSR